MVLWLLVLAMFMQGCCSFAVIGIMPEITRDLALAPGAAGWLVSAYTLAAIGVMPLQYKLARTYSPNDQATLGALLLALGALLTAVAPGYWELLASRAITGIGGAIMQPASLALASNAVPTSRRGAAISRVMAGFAAAHVVGIPLGSQVSAEFGWRAAYGGLAVAALLIAIGLRVGAQAAVAKLPPFDGSAWALLSNRRYALALVCAVLIAAGRIVILTLLSLFLIEHIGLGREHVPLALLAVGVTGLVGTVIGGAWVDSAGATAATAAAAIATAACAACLAGLTHPVLAVGMLSLLIACSSVSLVAQPALAITDAQASHLSVLLAANAASFAIGMTLGGATAGVVVEFGGYAALPVATAVAMSFAALAACLTRR